MMAYFSYSAAVTFISQESTHKRLFRRLKGLMILPAQPVRGDRAKPYGHCNGGRFLFNQGFYCQILKF